MKKILFITLTFLTTVTFGQRLQDFKKEESWYDFKNLKSQKIQLPEFAKNFKQELDLSANETLVENRREIDKMGRTHIFYNHYLNGIEVEYSQLILHSSLDSEFAEIANDKLSKKITSRGSVLLESDALTRALSAFRSYKYAWQDSLEEAELKVETNNRLATNYPKGVLIYAKSRNKPQSKENYQLCYKFTIFSLSPFYKKAVYIDAQTGGVFKDVDLIIRCNDQATATTVYNGNRQIITDWKGWPWSRFILIDCANRNIHTKYGSGSNPEAANGSTTWGTNHQTATSAHWAAEMTWDLYRTVYGRNGTNNSNREVKTLVDFPDLINNAYYDYSGGGNDKIRVGRTSVGNRTLASLDVMGHEITHGLTHATAKLVYEGESGALNESFSDIFGFMVERRSQPANFDWLLAEDPFFDNPIFIRDLQDPNLSGIPQPSVLGGANWFPVVGCTPSDGNDQCGVHRNSGVQNRWFFYSRMVAFKMA